MLSLVNLGKRIIGDPKAKTGSYFLAIPYIKEKDKRVIQNLQNFNGTALLQCFKAKGCSKIQGNIQVMK